MIKNIKIEDYKIVSISQSDYFRIQKHLSNLRQIPIENYPAALKKGLSDLLSSLSLLDGFEDKKPFMLDGSDEHNQFYTIPQVNFDRFAQKTTSLIHDLKKYNFNGELLSELDSIYNIWEEIEHKNNRKWNSIFNHLTGLLDQLDSRQYEVNSQSKSILDDIKEHSNSATSNISRHTQKQYNQLSNKASELQSELLSQIETAASNAIIDLKSESSKLGRELTEEITLIIDSSLEKKQKEIHDRNERQAKLLLEKVESNVSGLSNKVNEQINEFCALNDALRKTLNFVASDALADTSIKQAKEEKATADSLRGWGILWLIASIGLFLLTFDYDKLVDENNVPQYTLILLRSFFLIVGITPGFYLLRESARHRTDERRYRQKGIQLATIDGYFAEFEDSERNKVKKDLSKHYFHGAEHFVDSSSVDHIQSKYDKIFDKIASSKKFN
ncbi:hypothetical protein ACRRGR_000396 [Vibrio alginolyticus]|uniref:hypothetical protein n=1 Tax=Vibrio TaxID=662 RepID=UPI00111EC90E|nr:MULTISPECIES: hypothetical protein [Vibrio]MDW1540418.1 hypothetical protein [Vibrio sp. YT-17]TOH53257.1 hypothetical protein CGI78_22725 [Vibrio parahaemolyticus]